MRVILFGATGMVGRGVLRECLLDPGIETVLCVGRRAIGTSDAKVREIVTEDLTDLTGVEGDLRGFDAGFYCLGVSSAGMREEEYQRITYDLTISVAERLSRINPGMTFVYVSAPERTAPSAGGACGLA